MDRHDGIGPVVLAAEHLLRLGPFDLALELVERAFQIRAHVFSTVRPFDEDGNVVYATAQRLTQRDVVFDATPPLHHFLGFGLVVPEGRAGADLLDLG
jgi:hypothetical protein